MKYLSVLVAVILWLNTSAIYASPICGELDLPGVYGPFDYTKAGQAQRDLVEHYHFTKNVEQLVTGETGHIAADIGYTLHAFPNHHRALDAMGRLALREKTIQPLGARFTVLCYFDRAVRFKPDDVMVRLTFSNYLLKINKPDMALEQLLFAVDLEPDNPVAAYNLGLLYLKKRDYEKAVHFARKAYAQDFPLPGLKRQLIAAGKWKE